MAYNSNIKHFVTRLDGGVIWAPSTAYAADDVVIHLDNSYRALTAHTSSASFQTDLLAGRWLLLSADSINYISNPRAVVDTSGWTTYADSGAQPTDGTGGSPTVQWQRSTTTPLRGVADFTFTTPGGSVLGQGVATDITIDLADQAKVLTVSFDYEVLSGTYATGDLTVYLIADPSGTPVVIQPAGYQIQSGTAGTKLKQIATFQTQATGQSYRVCFHVASTSASAYSLAIDNVVVGPQTVQYGAPVTDWVSYTPTFTGFGTVATQTFWYRRIGDSVEIKGRFTAGTTTGVEARITLPSALTSDPAKVNGVLELAGKLDVNRSGTTFFSSGTVLIEPSVNYLTFGLEASTINGLSKQTGGTILASGEIASLYAKVPILGWSSTVQMSNDTDTRVVAASAFGGGAIAVTSATAIPYTNSVYDTHGALTLGTGRFTAPVSGYYEIKFAGWVRSVGTGNSVIVYKNGLLYQIVFSFTTAGFNFSGAATLYLNAGEYVDIRTDGAYTLSGGFTVYFNRLSGPSAIAATETVAATYSTNSAQTIPTLVDSVILNPSTKEFDTHGMFVAGSGYNSVTGAWTVQPGFVVPISGKYLVSWSAPIALPAATAYEVFSNVIQQRGGSSVFVSQGNRMNATTTGSVTVVSSGSSVFNALAGDKFVLGVFQASGASRGTGTDSRETKISIVRVGN